jgi:serine-type D-Ala-D-Ala carboxypeptidase/endopeptidase (penicillin-binding protein 4)
LLELFSSGLVSLWLKLAGMPDAFDPLAANSPDPSLEILANLLTPSTDRAAENILKQYLSQLESQGLSEATQGVWLQSGTTLLASNQGAKPLSAASLTKIATSLAALHTWSADYQFETLITTTGSIENGVLQGDLLIQAGGDPKFGFEEAIALGNALNKIGVSRISGNLLVSSNFMMRFSEDPTESGKLLKQVLNPKDWDEDARYESALLSPETRIPTVTIAGNIRLISSAQIEMTPKQILLMRHRSLPLIDLLKYMNVHSNNEMSQVLSDNMGGVAATMQKAIKAAEISIEELQLVNGSGLGVDNRISPRAACAMLAAIERYLYPRNLTIADLFPVSGIDAIGTTLEDRQMPRAAVVKTGTLNQVSALAGVLPTRDRGLVWFAIINQGTDITHLRNQQDRLLQALQKHWGGEAKGGSAIAPSPWIEQRQSTLGASTRNEIIYGG